MIWWRDPIVVSWTNKGEISIKIIWMAGIWFFAQRWKRGHLRMELYVVLRTDVDG